MPPNINLRMYVLKQIKNTIPRIDINDHQSDLVINSIKNNSIDNDNGS